MDGERYKNALSCTKHFSSARLEHFFGSFFQGLVLVLVTAFFEVVKTNICKSNVVMLLLSLSAGERYKMQKTLLCQILIRAFIKEVTKKKCCYVAVEV